MLPAGKRVIILDTQTGETRIIDPEAASANQTVEVGKACVAVNVLVNVAAQKASRDKMPPEKK